MLGNKAKREILRMNTAASFPYLLEIEHPDYGIFRYANVTDRKGIEFEGNHYESASFVITQPEVTQNGYTDAKLAMSCIDQEWIVKLRSTQKRATARFVAVILMDDDGNRTVEATEDLPFQLTSVSWNESVIEWTMEFITPLDISVPIDVANIENCPGCQ